MMRAALAASCLALAALPSVAQQQWSPDGWTPDGWSVEPLEDMPHADEMMEGLGLDQTQLAGRPLPLVSRPDPLVMQEHRTETRTAAVTDTAPMGAVLRGLDKLSGDTVDLTLAPGETGRVWRLTVTLDECRFPADNPASDAFAFLDISDPTRNSHLFSGWMIASSPALNPLDNSRYDVWVLRCKSS
ncbi:MULTISPECIES: DUF2155 domain-containing protein [Rhodovulum]|uniref:Uncharacterized protein DUF2155 n=2 Tax=Rhodovulum visakhapatnamense TaxID=364297 RepID=A0A4R8FPG0_9RHOB|nr:MULTISPECIES: DUF2155 domain-containing protein [Rhodovulum]TDX28298.1 uncharacterized protein DUF2155 [Rhodovulum visakhapatnamense]